MRLDELLKNAVGGYQVIGDSEIDVEGLFHNSKEAQKNGMFFAISGAKANGEDFVNEAIAGGAKVIVSSKPLTLPEGITNVVTSDVRRAMSDLAGGFYNHPSKDMFIIGITGTNGKTTSSFMIGSIFKEAGKKVGIIGSNGIYINGKHFNSSFTTPDPILLQEALAKMKKSGVGVVVMEVSAHALELQKIRGVMTDIALFTNLTQDHLDFFESMENYARAKAGFFERGMAVCGVVNLDDGFGKELLHSAKIPMLSYSRDKNQINSKEADIIVLNESHNTTSTTFRVKTPKGEEDITINLSGGFNVSNALGAISAGLIAGIPLETIKKGLNALQKVDGRFNTYDIGGIRVIIDYAHTPDGLENILKATREITEGSVYSVFGCGGNRDAGKRPIMGNISSRLADYTIITNDNPRFEHPVHIATEIEQGLEVGARYSIVLNREKAIKLAIAMAKPGDSVVIAGKGAEDYLDMQGVKTHFRDGEVVENIIKELEK